MHTIVFGSMTHVVLLAVDRFIAILFPHFYTSRITKTVIYVLSACLWGCALIIYQVTLEDINTDVQSQLTSCLLAGIGKGQWDRLERAHRCAARVVLQLPRSVMPSLQDLHWLPIRFRVKFKIAILVFK